MPRTLRVVVPNHPHHITQRGNNRQDVFFVDADRRVFLQMLHQACVRFGLTVNAYCLMANHFHLVCVPQNQDSLHLSLKWVGQLYAQYVNRLHDRSGHLWQDRPFSCPLDEEHYWKAMLYVERNPLRAKLVRQPWQWQWSSAAAHCGGQDPWGLLDLRAWAERMPSGWREELMRGQDASLIDQLRLCTSRGRPLGSDSFLSKLEHVMGRRLRALPRGRPGKK